MSMWVVEVDPEVSMSLRWWQEVIQIRHHVIWAGMRVCMYVCMYIRMYGVRNVQRADGRPGLGGVAALPHEVSLNSSR